MRPTSFGWRAACCAVPQRLLPDARASACMLHLLLLLPIQSNNHPPPVAVPRCCPQMHDGLDKANGSSVLMLPTHVLKLPTGCVLWVWVGCARCSSSSSGTLTGQLVVA